MTSLVPANNRESLTIRQSLTENESEWLNCLAETAVILLLKRLFYFELASETKRKFTQSRVKFYICRSSIGDYIISSENLAF